jgi:hypothetical protein
MRQVELKLALTEFICQSRLPVGGIGKLNSVRFDVQIASKDYSEYSAAHNEMLSVSLEMKTLRFKAFGLGEAFCYLFFTYSW